MEDPDSIFKEDGAMTAFPLSPSQVFFIFLEQRSCHFFRIEVQADESL
jgi:hypothetical protein